MAETPKPQPQRKQVSFTLPSMVGPRTGAKKVYAKLRASGAALVLLLGLVGGYGGAWLQDQTSSQLSFGSLSDQKKVVTSTGQLINKIAKDVGPSVVSVNVKVTTQTQSFFGFSQPSTQAGAGTGVILTSDGYILTNRHVVPTETTDISITLSNGTELKDVKVIGRTGSGDTLDIALLKITDLKGQKLVPAVLGDSAQVGVGDGVVAIGNALGQFQNTVTSGIISGFGRSITAGSSSADAENLDDLFQTDAAINQGNSGGPLVNLNGQVIGINVAIAGNAQNIGFAIPINDVKGLVQNAIKTGKFERPYLGIRYIPLTADIAKQYGLSVTNGAYIAPAASADSPSVLDGSPAADAGLKVGDIITKIDGTSIDSEHSLTSLLGKHLPGDKLELTVVNGSDTRTVSITVGSAPVAPGN